MIDSFLFLIIVIAVTVLSVISGPILMIGLAICFVVGLILIPLWVIFSVCYIWFLLFMEIWGRLKI